MPSSRTTARPARSSVCSPGLPACMRVLSRSSGYMTHADTIEPPSAASASRDACLGSVVASGEGRGARQPRPQQRCCQNARHVSRGAPGWRLLRGCAASSCADGHLHVAKRRMLPLSSCERRPAPNTSSASGAPPSPPLGPPKAMQPAAAPVLRPRRRLASRRRRARGRG